ncbi:MAG: ATP-binding protein [Leptolyngbyaceae cyanobacterium SM1_1_3]|nr:ATP-binding protein [Leptolyngbyaceae cyanobacterium SM1_1_3]NJN04301.1 ATP-binding protein [Leptolyngbyaceae cyanobacterium RM1_1_2]
MAANSLEQWREANHDYLMETVAQVIAYLGRKAHLSESNEIPADPQPLQPPAALEQLCSLLGLSRFERDVLLLCAGVELNPVVMPLCASAQADLQQGCPTYNLALSIFPLPHWWALAPESALRCWHLIEVGGGNALTYSPLRIDERILHYLLGIEYIDIRLRGILTPLEDAFTLFEALPPSYQAIAEQVAQVGLQDIDKTAPAIQLYGSDEATKRAIALAACRQMNRQGLLIAADVLPIELGQFNLIKVLCEREALLSHSILVLDCSAVSSFESAEGVIAQQNSAIVRLIDALRCPVIVLSRDRRAQHQRPLITFAIAAPTHQEQRSLWQIHLGETAAELNGYVDTLVSYFNLTPAGIQAACEKTKRLLREPPEGKDSSKLKASSSPLPLPSLLWEACLTQARPQLDELAQAIPPSADWHNLVLPEKEFQVLQTIAAHVRQRFKVYEQWGFGRSGRGLGISTLFAGPSGTGKTLAAEVLASDLKLDLYRVDLSTVVSKYIGETEKNLRRIFDAAETGGAILLFDEADALFGKRSEVKDSHDRYANMEVAYLLQRIESYRGLAILTTNLKSSLDQAFLRRIRFIVQFPFPDAKQRAEIWRRIFPAQTPLQDLLYEKLAKLSVSGGNIRNIALNAAFLAADANESVQMHHILQASQAEYIKLERPLTDAEVKGWLPKQS